MTESQLLIFLLGFLTMIGIIMCVVVVVGCFIYRCFVRYVIKTHASPSRGDA